MKQLTVIGTCCLLFIFSIYTSCKKTETVKEHTVMQKSELIAAAKTYFELTIGTVQVTENAAASEKGIGKRQEISKAPLWETAYIVHIKEKSDAVVVSLQYEKPLNFTTSFGNDNKLSMDTQSKLWIFKDSLGKYKSEVVITLPSKAYLEGKIKSFEGYVLTEDWNGDNMTKQKYFANKTHQAKIKDAKKPSTQDNNVAARGMCNVIYWYLCDVDSHGVHSNCVYQYTQILACDDDNDPHDTLEPPEESGGGGGEEQQNCGNQLQELLNGVSSASEIIDETTENEGPVTKTKKYQWKILESTGWYIFSFEKGVLEKTNNSNPLTVWKWQSLDNLGISLVGIVTGGSADPSLISAIPTLGQYNAVMDIDFKVKYSVVCSISPISYTSVYNSSHIFKAN